MKNILIFATIVSIVLTSLYSGETRANQPRVNWLTMEEALERHRQNPKKIFVDIYTDWCGWCKRMESETFSHPVIVEYINTNFYPVKLNAEYPGPIVFGGVTYVNEQPQRRGSPHNLAVAILQGRMSYPSVAFFDEQLRLIYALPGFRAPVNMEPVLVFFAEGIYEENPNLDSFITNFHGRISR